MKWINNIAKLLLFYFCTSVILTLSSHNQIFLLWLIFNSLHLSLLTYTIYRMKGRISRVKFYQGSCGPKMSRQNVRFLDLYVSDTPGTLNEEVEVEIHRWWLSQPFPDLMIKVKI